MALFPFREGQEENVDKEEKSGIEIRAFLAELGISICSLNVAKVRDGMEKFNIITTFFFRKNTFTKIDWEMIRGDVMQYKNNKNIKFQFKKNTYWKNKQDQIEELYK